MGRDEHNRSRGKNKNKLPQTPSNQKSSDGIDVEFSYEFADKEDMEAQQRSKEADKRAERK